jgi:hypothetical protein
VRISKLWNNKKITSKEISKMKDVCKKYGEILKVKDGKVIIEEMNDIDVILKMLVDYYKKGEVSGESYGSWNGKKINNTLFD